MPKKITVEHKKELLSFLKKDDKTNEEIIKYFKDKYRVQVTNELIQKTRELSQTFRR